MDYKTLGLQEGRREAWEWENMGKGQILWSGKKSKCWKQKTREQREKTQDQLYFSFGQHSEEQLRALDNLFGDVNVKRKTTSPAQDVVKINELAVLTQMGSVGMESLRVKQGIFLSLYVTNPRCKMEPQEQNLRGRQEQQGWGLKTQNPRQQLTTKQLVFSRMPGRMEEEWE